MKFLITATMPVEKGNQMIKHGKLSATVQSVVEALKPEAAYFGLKGGTRAMYLIVEMSDASQLPAIAEPLFLGFDAAIEAIPVMQSQDLMKAGPAIEAAVKKFGA
jgi:hypothetical protein